MGVGYFDIKEGMEFDEVGGGRRVRVVRSMPYAAQCKVVSGRGAGRDLRVYRKQLSNPDEWRLVDQEAGSART